MKLFHGTRSAGDIFASGFEASPGGEFGPGVYLTERPEAARFWASICGRGSGRPTVVEVEASLANPRRVSKLEWIKLTERSTPRAVQRRWMKAGHDGILGVGINGIDVQVVAFDASAVRPVAVVDREEAGRGWVGREEAEPASAVELREAIERFEASQRQATVRG